MMNALKTVVRDWPFWGAGALGISLGLEENLPQTTLRMGFMFVVWLIGYGLGHVTYRLYLRFRQ